MNNQPNRKTWRQRSAWAAVGAAVAVTLGLAGTGAINLVDAAVSSGSKAIFVPVTPERILDTRDGTGGVTGPIVGGGSFELQVTGVAGIPSDATAVVLNVTATSNVAPTFITVWPAGVTRPVVSNLNPAPGDTVPNLVNVQLGAGGRLGFYNAAGSVQLIADVAGYYVDHNHDDRYYSKEQVDAMFDEFDPVDPLAWAKFTSPGGGSTDLIVYQSEGAAFAIDHTGTGVYEVTVGGFLANGAYQGVFVTPVQGQTTVFRACKLFQTVANPAGELVLRIRCYDADAALQDTPFNILVIGP